MHATSHLPPAARYRAERLESVITEWIEDDHWDENEMLDETLRFDLAGVEFADLDD